MSRSEIVFDHLTLRFPGQATALLENFNFQLRAGCWTTIVGQSGCGKTTLLRLLAGLLDSSTTDSAAHPVISGSLPQCGPVAYMAQQDLLLPWLSVLDNACLISRFQPSDKAATPQLYLRATALLQQVGLGQVLDARPSALSGGMRQRVALVRTLLQNRDVVLMDEPFSALDAVTRHQLQALAATLLRGKTVLFITHDPQEALRLADDLYLMAGRPATMTPITLPDTATPRPLDAALANLQQQLLTQLEQAHD